MSLNRLFAVLFLSLVLPNYFVLLQLYLIVLFIRGVSCDAMREA